ncbi:MAG: AraC family transcriptional regulator [Clostridia bacterium]|nr:AraC family transcriptional regulator [Clostridia bacterium]
MKTKDVPLYIEHKWVKNYTIPANRSYILIAYIAYGQGTVKIENQEIYTQAKDIFIVNPNISAEFISTNSNAENYNFEIHYILFEKDFLCGAWESYAEEFIELESFFKVSGKNYIMVKDNDMCEIRNYIVRLTNEYYEDVPARNSALLGNMLAMLPIIFRRYNINEKQIFSKNTLVDQTIRQIRNTIYQNPKPSEIASHRFVTIDHLGRVFKQETGMTITQYINNLRVEITKDILENTDRPIEHIPVVFNIKLKYLQQIFKRYTGMSMREYRSKYHYR